MRVMRVMGILERVSDGAEFRLFRGLIRDEQREDIDEKRIRKNGDVLKKNYYCESTMEIWYSCANADKTSSTRLGR